MDALTRSPRQVAGGTPLGLALLLERRGVRLVAPARTLAPGLELLEFVASFTGPRPATAASCRERVCRADGLRLRVDAAWLLARVRGQLVGARLPGWRVEHVAWDMLEGTGDGAAWILRGVADCGAAVWLRIELQVRAAGGQIVVGARRCWLLGPPELAAGRIWRALVRRLGRGPGLCARREGLVIAVLRASLGAEFAAAGWRLPDDAALRCRWELRGEAVHVSLDPGPGATSWPEGQVDALEDPLAQVRVWLRGGPAALALADAELHALAAAHPEVAVALLRALALALRFVAPVRCIAALVEWAGAAPDDGEVRWLLAVQHANLGDSAGLIAALRCGSQGAPRRLALALALQRFAGDAAEALVVLEPLVAELPGHSVELQAAVWRALARARAADRATPALAVLAAVNAALGEEGWRRREEAGELRAQVAAAVVTSGRPEAETTPLLRRLLGDVRPGRWDRPAPPVEPAPGRAARRERGEGRASTRLVSEYLAQEGRWSELVMVLERQLVRLAGLTRIQALRRIARIHRHHLRDAVSAEQALRVALEHTGEDAATRREQHEARAELVTCLEMQGRGEAAEAERSEPVAGDVVEGRSGEGPVAGDAVEDVPRDRLEAVRVGPVAGDAVEDVPWDGLDVGRVGPAAGDAVEDVPWDRSEAGQVGPAAGDAVEDVSWDRLSSEAALSRTLVALAEDRGAVDFTALLADVRAQALAEAKPGASAWSQLAAFLAPQGEDYVAPWPALPPDVWAAERLPAADAREAVRGVLRMVAGELAGIRAAGSAGPQGSQVAQAMTQAEAELGPLRAALGLQLPLCPGSGAAEGGVGVRNERPPVIGVGAALAGLSPAERRFRLTLAAVMIGGGLAIVTDPQGASLPELLGALHHLADATCPIRLPGAQAIVRALAARGFDGARLPAGLREALALELAGWQQSRVSLTRLAQLLRRDSLWVALRLSGALDGGLRTLARDARLPADDEGALTVLASADGQCLLRAAGLIG